MNKTDVAFWVSFIGLEAKSIQEAITTASPHKLIDWVMVSLGIIAGACFALYDHFTGTTPVEKI